MKLFSTAIAASLFTATGALGGVLLTDDFSYADGSLTSNATWESHSGTEFDMLVTSGAVVVQHGVPSEDAQVLFGSQTSGILTADFDIVVNDDTVIGGNDFEYFAHFRTQGSFNFRARLDVVPATVAGDYTLGISSGSSTAEATLATDFNYGDTVPVSLSFDLDTGSASLTAGGETISGTGIFLGEDLDAFSLRQSDSSNNETVTVDNLVISSSIPEPGSVALFGLAGLLGLLRRRR